MRIAQVAPLYESVPPKLYGGTERVVHFLTEELVRMGHEVTLFASADSRTSARLLPQSRHALRLDPDVTDPIAHHVLMSERIFRMANEFDIIHSHIDYLPYSLFRRLSVPCVTTLHGRLDLKDLPALYAEFQDMPVVSISNAQRAPLPMANWLSTVYHGLYKDGFAFRAERGKYLAFLGRISPEKRVDLAIEIAVKAGIPIRIAAKVDRVDVRYFETVVRPLLDHPLVEYIGEINEAQKNDFLGNALALLFPIDWPEPFGLVMIEAMACGTPVIARPRGSVPEVIEPGANGFLFESIEEGASAVRDAQLFDRRLCREVFEKRFTSDIMATHYLEAYHQLLEKTCPT